MTEEYGGFLITRDINAGAYAAAVLGLVLLAVLLLRWQWLLAHMGPRGLYILTGCIAVGTLFSLGLSAWVYAYGRPQVLVTLSPQGFHCRAWPESQLLPWSQIETLTTDSVREAGKEGARLRGHRIRIRLRAEAPLAVTLGQRDFICELPAIGVSAADVARAEAYWRHYRDRSVG